MRHCFHRILSLRFMQLVGTTELCGCFPVPCPKTKVQNGDNNRKFRPDESLVPTKVLQDHIPDIVCSTRMLVAQLISWSSGKRKTDDACKRQLSCNSLGWTFLWHVNTELLRAATVLRDWLHCLRNAPELSQILLTQAG